MTQTAEPMTQWAARAEDIRWDVRPFIDGRYQSSRSDATFEDINPATETTICLAPAGAAADVDEAVRVARERFTEGCWSRLPALRRKEILFKFADIVEERADELALLDSLEMGKPIAQSLFDSGQTCPYGIRAWAEFADKLVGETAPFGTGVLSFNTYEPRGVVGAITPWNFPAQCAIVKMAPALAAGNSLVLKPSELCPSSALLLAEMALEAGVPEGVVNVVPGLGSTAGAALALHPDVDFLAFTGSTATGRKIMGLAAQSNGKPVMLECGGKSPTSSSTTSKTLITWPTRLSRTSSGTAVRCARRIRE